MRHWRTWLGGTRTVVLLVLVLAAVAVAAVVPRAGSWLGSWKQALDLAAGSTALLGPVAAGAACLAYSRLRSSAASDLVLQSSREWSRWLQPFLAVWALASAALVAVAVGATTAASLAGVPSYPQLAWVLLPAVAVLGAQTAIGAAIGYASGRPWAAPLAVVVVFLLFLWTVNGPVPTLFVTGGVTGTLAGETFAVLPVLGPGVFALGLGWCVLVAAQRALASTRARLVVLAAAVVLVAVGWRWTAGDNDRRYVPVADPELACDGSAPEVCVPREVPRPLADLAAKAERQARALVAIGAPVPHRFATAQVANRADGIVQLWVEEETRRTISEDSVTRTLVTPARCADDTADQPVQRLPFEERHLLGRWLQVKAGLLEPDRTDGDAAWLAATSVTPQEQEEWVRTTYRRLVACDFGAIRMPDGLG